MKTSCVPATINFGRLVLYGTRPAGSFDWSTRTIRYAARTETLFAVGWPVLRMEYRPLWSGRDKDLDDEAVFRGEAGSGGRPVYIFLPDGRIDLLPVENTVTGVLVGVTAERPRAIGNLDLPGGRTSAGRTPERLTPHLSGGSRILSRRNTIGIGPWRFVSASYGRSSSSLKKARANRPDGCFQRGIPVSWMGPRS